MAAHASVNEGRLMLRVRRRNWRKSKKKNGWESMRRGGVGSGRVGGGMCRKAIAEEWVE